MFLFFFFAFKCWPPVFPTKKHDAAKGDTLFSLTYSDS